MIFTHTKHTMSHLVDHAMQHLHLFSIQRSRNPISIDVQTGMGKTRVMQFLGCGFPFFVGRGRDVWIYQWYITYNQFHSTFPTNSWLEVPNVFSGAARKVWSLTCPTTEIRGFWAPCVVGVDPLFEPSKSTTGNLDEKNSLKNNSIIFVVPLLNKATKTQWFRKRMGTSKQKFERLLYQLS